MTIFCTKTYNIKITKLNYLNCTFINNYSSKKGGVFSILFGDLADVNSYYYNNTALIGGSIYIDGYCGCNLTGGIFALGKADYGGVFRISDGATFFISNTLFNSNSASEGACFSLEGFQINLKVL